MQVTYLLLAFTSLYLAGTYFYYRHTQKKGAEFRYKPIFLFIVVLLFLVALYAAIVQKPYNEILPFIG